MADTSHIRRGDIFFAISEQLFHLINMDLEAVDVRSQDATATLHEETYTCSIARIYVKQHRTLPISLVDPLTLMCWFRY